MLNHRQPIMEFNKDQFLEPLLEMAAEALREDPFKCEWTANCIIENIPRMAKAWKTYNVMLKWIDELRKEPQPIGKFLADEIERRMNENIL